MLNDGYINLRNILASSYLHLNYYCTFCYECQSNILTKNKDFYQIIVTCMKYGNMVWDDSFIHQLIESKNILIWQQTNTRW